MRKAVAFGLLAGYLALLLDLTLVQGSSPGAPANLVPFRTIAHYLRVGGWGMVVNFWGNLAAFAPLGVFVPVLARRERSAWRVAWLGLMLSGAIETLQFLSGRRVADVDDVLLNVLGALIGFGVWLAWTRSTHRGRVGIEPST